MSVEWHIQTDSVDYRGGFETGDVTWPMPQYGRHGTAKVFVPRLNAEAFSLIDTGTWLTMYDDAHGYWYGRIPQNTPPTFRDDGADISVMHVSYMFKGRKCYSKDDLRGLTCGGIIRRAFKLAFGDGMEGHLTLGTVLEAGPVYPRYQMDGQFFDTVCQDMEKWSGQTWEIAENGILNWIPNANSLYTPILEQDSDIILLGNGPDVLSNDVVGQVFARDKIGRIAASPSVASSITDMQKEIRVDTTSWPELIQAADMEIARAGIPAIIFPFMLKPGPTDASRFSGALITTQTSGRIPLLLINENNVSAFQHYRSIRTGTVVQFTLPRSRKDGDVGIGQVVNRIMHGATGLIELRVQQILPITQTTIQAEGRGISRMATPSKATFTFQPITDTKPLADPDIDALSGVKVFGKVGQASQADTATTATSAGSASSVPATGVTAGALPAGVTIPGGQVTSAVPNATNANFATTANNLSTAGGVPSGNLNVGVAADPASLQNGALQAGVQVPSAQLTGTIPTARMPNGGAVANATTWTDTTAQTQYNDLITRLRTTGIIS